MKFAHILIKILLTVNEFFGRKSYRDLLIKNTISLQTKDKYITS